MFARSYFPQRYWPQAYFPQAAEFIGIAVIGFSEFLGSRISRALLDGQYMTGASLTAQRDTDADLSGSANTEIE